MLGCHLIRKTKNKIFFLFLFCCCCFCFYFLLPAPFNSLVSLRSLFYMFHWFLLIFFSFSFRRKNDQWVYKTNTQEYDKCIAISKYGSWDSLLVRVPDSWSKGCKFESRQEWQENFLFLSSLCVLTLIRCPLHPHVTAVAGKRPWCRWQIIPKHAHSLDQTKSEWADYATV